MKEAHRKLYRKDVHGTMDVLAYRLTHFEEVFCECLKDKRIISDSTECIDLIFSHEQARMVLQNVLKFIVKDGHKTSTRSVLRLDAATIAARDFSLQRTVDTQAISKDQIDILVTRLGSLERQPN